MLAKLLVIAGLASAGLLLIILTMTTPASSGAFGILAVFLLSYVVALTITTYLVWLLSKLMSRLVAGASGHKPPLTFKKAYYYSTVIAIGPVIIVSLESVGGAGIYEVGLVCLFVILGCIYVSRRAA